MKTCDTCGKEHDSDSAFCSSCDSSSHDKDTGSSSILSKKEEPEQTVPEDNNDIELSRMDKIVGLSSIPGLLITIGLQDFFKKRLTDVAPALIPYEYISNYQFWLRICC
jgi:Predicted membrane protein